MTIEEQIMKLQTYKMFEGEDTIYVERDEVLKLLEQQPSREYISRFDVLNLFNYGKLDEDIVYSADVMNAVRALPSVTPKVEWIPVSERLPEEAYGCIVTVMDTNPMTLEEFENIYPDFVGWDGENWNDADGDSIPFEVIAWMPLPPSYQGEEEKPMSANDLTNNHYMARFMRVD